MSVQRSPGAQGPAGDPPPPPSAQGPAGDPPPAAAPDVLARRRRNVTALGAIGAILVGVAFVGYAVAVSRQVPTVKYANLVVYASPVKAPSFDLARLGSGAPVTSAGLLGKGPAVVNWFQSTCVACQAELGTFASVADEERAKVHFLGVDINDPSPAAALSMLRRAKADYPVGEAPGGASISLATRFGVGDLPATVFVSAGGSILGEVLGKIPRAELVALLGNLAAGRPLNS